jgi:poly(U)-specific endoribonuclease
MTSIYQQIWDADLTGNGVRSVFDSKTLSTEEQAAGYVKVNSKLDTSNDPDLRVLTAVSIPTSKMRTYDLCRQLFENYALDQQDVEVETPEEREEIHNLLQAIVDTAPMQVARNYVQSQIGTTVSKERWYSTLLELWFRRFTQESGRDLSAFEHVIVGEQKGAKVSGYHFWYKYYLDDGLARQVDGGRNNFPGLSDDRIVYLASEASDSQSSYPESVTISYRWKAPDYDAQRLRPLTKPTGGFFVGCSIEGLMAIGTVRAHVSARAPKEAVINGARYDLKVFRSDDNKNLRTFYPVFLGAAGEIVDTRDGEEPSVAIPVVSGDVKIIAALVNPVGDDPGAETITLLNMSSTNISLTGWRVLDKMNNDYEIADLTLRGGSAATIVLPKNSMQLSNKGGEIRLVNTNNQIVHRVTYSKEQATREGLTITF